MFLARDNLEEGENLDNLSYPTMPVNIHYTEYDNFSEVDERDQFPSTLSKSDTDVND